MKHITVVTPGLNEQGNVEDIYAQTKVVFSSLEGVQYEHINFDALLPHS